MPQRKTVSSQKRKIVESPTGSKKRSMASMPKQSKCVESQSADLLADFEESTAYGPETNEEMNVDDGSAIVQDDDEEAWLDALEKGDLDDYGELKREKDPSLLTARQKALKERTGTSVKPATSNTPKIEMMSEEAQKKKAEKNKRRKLQAVRKAEESQKQTIERLIKQQGLRGNKDRQRKSVSANENPNSSQTVESSSTPMIKYLSKGHTITISFPINVDCPLKPSVSSSPKPIRKCAICGKPKRYNCSRTHKPVCSMECYKSNIEMHLSAS